MNNGRWTWLEFFSSPPVMPLASPPSTCLAEYPSGAWLFPTGEKSKWWAISVPVIVHKSYYSLSFFAHKSYYYSLQPLLSACSMEFIYRNAEKPPAAPLAFVALTEIGGMGTACSRPQCISELANLSWKICCCPRLFLILGIDKTNTIFARRTLK